MVMVRNDLSLSARRRTLTYTISADMTRDRDLSLVSSVFLPLPLVGTVRPEIAPPQIWVTISGFDYQHGVGTDNSTT